MKILIDARLYGLEHAGLGRYTINLLDELSKIDHKNEYSVLLRKDYFNKLNFPKNFKKVLADFRHYTLTEQIKLPGIINKEKPDVVHFLHMNVPLFYRKKFVVTVHDLLMQKHRGARATTLPFYKYFSKLLAAKYVFKNAVLSAKKIIVPSNAVKEEIVSFYRTSGDKIETIYEGVGKTSENKSGSKKVMEKLRLESPYFIYSGNAYPHKNLDAAIKAIKELNQEGIQVNFYITSSRSVFTKKLENLIQKENVGKFIKYLGFLDDSDLFALFENSVGFLYPSISEGFGLQGLEAMQSKTVLVCSNIPVFKEIYKNIPVYFDPYSISSIKSAIKKDLNFTPVQRKAVIQKGVELAKTYSWENMARKTLQVYEEVLQPRV